MEHEQEERMNIYRFIDSRDMRKHLQKLNYSFTAPEAAFLVYWCKDATLEERIAAWREIIDTMPNCAMAERLNLEAIPDFHQFLRDYIDLQWIYHIGRPGRDYTVCVSRSSSPQLFGFGVLSRTAEGHPQAAETHQQISQGRAQH